MILRRLYGTRGWIVLGICSALLYTVPFFLSPYWNSLLGKITCYAMVAVAMDLIWGYAGILSLGHGLFFALGGDFFGMYRMRRIGRHGQ